MKEVIDIFPIPIYCKKYFAHDAIKNFFYDSKDKLIKNNSGSDKNLIHYHSRDHSVLNDIKYIDFKLWCEETCKDYIKNVLGYVVYDKIFVTDSWINVCLSGGNQYYHNHTNSFVSATYYINYNKEEHAPLSFFKPSFSLESTISLDTNDVYNKFNSVDFYPEEGCIILWPSYLKHGYNNNIGDDRMTISMNFMPSVVKHGPHMFQVSPV